MALTDAKAHAARPKEKSYRLFDAGGMYLEVMPSGGKLWRFKYRFNGKEKRFALGVYPEVDLRNARIERDEARKLLSDGIDPSERRKVERTVRHAELDRQVAATHFNVDSDGALSFRLGHRRLLLTPSETAELRVFLDATRGVTPKVNHADRNENPHSKARRKPHKTV